MTKWDSHVFPHGPLEEISQGLWLVTGSLKKGPLPRNMVIYRLPDGGLWIHSAIALDSKGMRDLEKLGEPSVMIVPSPFHRIDAGVYKERYPRLQVYCPRGIEKRVGEVVPVNGSCEDALPAHGIKSIAIPGIKPIELCYQLRLETGGTCLVFNDALMNLSHLPGLQGWILKCMGSTGFFGLTTVGKMLMLKNKNQFRAWLMEQANAHVIKTILMSHGEPITKDCNQELKNAAARL